MAANHVSHFKAGEQSEPKNLYSLYADTGFIPSTSPTIADGKKRSWSMEVSYFVLIQL